jgi:hypothetical protein
VSTYQLVDVLRKHQVAHLASCLQVVDRLKRMRVPESDALVGRASAAREEPVLVRRPGDGFDGCQVMRKLCLWRRVVLNAPYHQLVVVAS